MNESSMSFERQAYEIDDLWKPENTTKRDLDRIKHTAEHIPTNTKSILDIGCGGGIFLNYLLKESKLITRLCGVDRSLEALKYVQTEKYACNVEALPFKNNEFDLVTALEVIEHLPQEIYVKALSEIARISNKYILISVPNSENIDRSLKKCPLCLTRFNPDFHMRSYNRDILTGLFGKFNFQCIDYFEICGINFYKWSDKINLRKSNLDKPLPWYAICPVCGYKSSDKRTNNATLVTKPRKKLLKESIKLIWPKEIRFQWIAAVYKRQG